MYVYVYIYISTQFHTRRCFAHVFFVPACMFNLQLTLDVYELVLLWLSNQSKMHRDLQQSPVFQRSQLKIVVLGSAKPFFAVAWSRTSPWKSCFISGNMCGLPDSSSLNPKPINP